MFVYRLEFAIRHTGHALTFSLLALAPWQAARPAGRLQGRDLKVGRVASAWLCNDSRLVIRLILMELNVAERVRFRQFMGFRPTPMP